MQQRQVAVSHKCHLCSLFPLCWSQAWLCDDSSSFGQQVPLSPSCLCHSGSTGPFLWAETLPRAIRFPSLVTTTRLFCFSCRSQAPSSPSHIPQRLSAVPTSLLWGFNMPCLYYLFLHFSEPAVAAHTSPAFPPESSPAYQATIISVNKQED